MVSLVGLFLDLMEPVEHYLAHVLAIIGSSVHMPMYDTGELKIWLESGFHCETVDSYGV